MTDNDRKLTVRRLCGWLTLLSDRARLATIDECCMAERYAGHLHRTVPKRLQDNSTIRNQLTVMEQRAKSAGRLQQIRAEVAEFARRVLATDWARQALLSTWLYLARQFETIHAAYRVRCGFPKWAKYADYLEIKKG